MVKKTTKKEVTKKKSKAGQPSKFNQFKNIIKIATSHGNTDSQIAELCGVTPTTFANWKTQHKQYFETIKEIKKESDQEVVTALRMKATGFVRIKKTKIMNLAGIEVGTNEEEVYYPPDTKACEIWLTNRQPDDWKRIKHVDVTTLGNQLPVPIINVTNLQTKIGLDALNNE
jgi:hypothetical protein